jgi:hypothetical protein
MKNIIKNNKAWENQAVLAWNRFYTAYEEQNDQGKRVLLNGKLQFIIPDCREYRNDVIRFTAKFKGERGWRDWSGILCELEVFDKGFNKMGYATKDPKEVVWYELFETKDCEINEAVDREWVKELKDEILGVTSESDGIEYNSESYDSDSGWESFGSSDLMDGEKTWQ